MLSNLHTRLRAQAGAGQVAVIGVALGLCVLVGAAFALFNSTSVRPPAANRDLSAQRVALQASEAASSLAGEHHGSFATVGLLSLHKDTLVPIRPAGGDAWLSAAAGTAHTYSLTVSASDGNTFTITRASDGSLSGTCHVVAGAGAGSGCEHVDASGAGVW
jgi:hypothetical protein